MTTRQQHILEYADYLRSDAALWRITVAYMGACGDAGTQRMDEVLLRVPVVPGEAKTIAIDGSNTSEGGVTTAVPPILKEVVQVCFEYEREHVRRTVCSVCVQGYLPNGVLMSRKIAAQAFLRRKLYGLAISYLTSAENWTALGHVIDNMLSEFIQHGNYLPPSPPQLTIRITILPRRRKVHAPCQHCCSISTGIASSPRCYWHVYPPSFVCSPIRRISPETAEWRPARRCARPRSLV